MKKKIGYIFFLVLLSSCLEEADCVKGITNEVRFAFKNKTTGGNRGQVPIIEVKLSGTDSLFYVSDTTNGFIVPLNYHDSTSTVILKTNFGTDTISFEYSTSARLISPECGSEIMIHGFQIRDHTFDSLKIISNTLSPLVPVNYEIYY